MRAAPVADRLARALVAEVRGRDRALVRKALVAARRLRLMAGDPVVRHRLDGTDLLLPLSHDLPIHRARYPDYSRNLGVVAAAVAAADPTATLVDIGANVGDSVVIVRARTPMPILCVEGDEVFLPYLHANVAGATDVEVAAEYVSIGVDGAIGVDRSAGTARLVPQQAAAPGGDLGLRSLEEILTDHPRFGDPGLLKLDTDGNDAAIVIAAAPVLERSRPALFFEHDPALNRAVGAVDPLAVLEVLVGTGYRHVAIWANTGQLLMAEADGLEPALRTWTDELGRPGAPAYYDVAALHADDAALLEALAAG